jgi:plastocyanin
VAVLALAATALLAGCGGETDHLKVTDGPLQPSGNGFTPAQLTAHTGHKVQIAVTNTAKDKEHGFSIDEYGVKEVVKQGTTTTVKFKADKAGTFKIYCQIHPTHQTAQLIIS